MRTITARIVLLLFLSGVLSAQARRPADSGRVPVLLEVKPYASAVQAGSKCDVTVSLKNFRNEPVPALKDVEVMLSLGSMGDNVSLTVLKGQTSATAQVTPSRSGAAEIEASSPGLFPGSALLLVRPRKRAAAAPRPLAEVVVAAAPGPVSIGEERPEPLRAEVAAPATSGGSGQRGETVVTMATEGAVAGAEAAPPPPPVAAGPSRASASEGPSSPQHVPTEAAPPVQPAGPPPANVGMKISSPIPPSGDRWTTGILLTVLAANGAVTKATGNLTVILTANRGSVSPNRVAIQAGQDTPEAAVTLASQSSGNDVVTAQSTLGPPVKEEVVYGDFPPDRLVLKTSPAEAPDDGKSSVTVQVFLQNIASKTVKAEQDLDVSLSSTLGELGGRNLKIDKGKFSTETTLTSSKPGEAKIRAVAPGLAEAEASARFFFPLGMILFAALGGAFGGFAASIRESVSARWKSHLWRNLLLGVVLGVCFWGLVFFGATTVLPKTWIEIDVTKLPTYNTMASFLLGFFGGVALKAAWQRFAPAD